MTQPIPWLDGPLWLRVGALTVTLAIIVIWRRRIVLAVLAGEATLMGGIWMLN
jgi:hypothetical protein